MGWLIIVLLLITVFVFVKATNLGQNMWSYLIVVFIIFLLITFAYVSTFPEVTFENFDGIVDFSRVYMAWLNHFFGNIAHITGQAVNLEWSLNNSTSAR